MWKIERFEGVAGIFLQQIMAKRIIDGGGTYIRIGLKLKMQVRVRRTARVSTPANQLAFFYRIAGFYLYRLKFQMAEFGIQIVVVFDNHRISPVVFCVHIADGVVGNVVHHFGYCAVGRRQHSFPETVIIFGKIARIFILLSVATGNDEIKSMAPGSFVGVFAVVRLAYGPFAVKRKGCRNRVRRRETFHVP